MRTIVANRKKICPRQFVIPKEKRDELNNLLHNFYEQSEKTPTFHEFENYCETLYKSFLDDAIQNRPKLSQERNDLLKVFSKLFRENKYISLDQKQDFIDIMYNLLLNNENLSHNTISEEKINELRIILKNSLASEHSILRAKGNMSDAIGYTIIFEYHSAEQYYEDICKKLLNAL